MKLRKLDPNVFYENYMIKAIREGKEDPVKFHKRVQGIIREAQERAYKAYVTRKAAGSRAPDPGQNL